MNVFRFSSALFVLTVATVLAQSLENREWNLSRKNRAVTTNNNTCPRQKLTQPYSPVGAILKSRESRKNIFHAGEKAEFVCKDDYRQIGELQSFICEEHGTWKEYSKHQTGFCVLKRCNVETFSCKNGNTKIDACKQCDCVADCPDLSDEESCAPTLVDVTGKATGHLLASSASRKPNETSVTCNSWKLQTNDRGFYIKLLFKTFSMSPDCTQNYVSLENANFTDPTRTAKCCKNSDGEVCRFGGVTSPPLSRTITNWITVKFFSETNESHFSAVWYNVNGLFPDGSIPSQDSTYAPRIKIPTTRTYQPKPTAPSVLAFVLFALLMFAIGSFIACKLGKRFLGPRCSFRHFFAWVLRRPIPPEAPSRPAEVPPEERALTADTDTPSRLQATYLGDESDESWRGSSDNII